MDTSEIEYKIYRLESSVNQLESMYVKNDLETIKNIMSQMVILDGILEHWSFPPKLLERYNQIRRKYLEMVPDQKLYITTDRSMRIDRILKDAENMKNMQSLMCEYVNSHDEKIENIENAVLNTNQFIIEAVDELERYKKKKESRMRIWRFLYMIVFIMSSLLIYNLISNVMQ